MVDPTGHFVITLASIVTTFIVTAIAALGIGAATDAMVKKVVNTPAYSPPRSGIGSGTIDSPWQKTATFAGSQTQSKVKEKDVATTTTATKDKLPDSTPIYRKGNPTNVNLTPRLKDVNGLSYQLTVPTGDNYVMTTIGAVKNTGVLTAVRDRSNHVSVVPTNPLTLTEWQYSREHAKENPHPYTIVLRLITIPFNAKGQQRL